MKIIIKKLKIFKGHIGHVELLLPVYNPFIIDRLLKLLRYRKKIKNNSTLSKKTNKNK